MAALQCEICGGKLMGRPGGIFECDSCGMEYDTAWAKQKIQEIRGTVKVEGTVSVRVDQSQNLENLLDRGNLALEDGDWAKADRFFEDALNQDAQCAAAYLGKALAEQKHRNLRAMKRASLTRWEDLAQGRDLFGNKELYRAGEEYDYIHRYAVGGLLTEESIEEMLKFDRTYFAPTEEAEEFYAQEEEFWKKHRDMQRAFRFAKGDLARELMEAREAILDAAKACVEKLRKEEDRRRRDLEARYGAFLAEKEALLRGLSAEKSQEQQQELEQFREAFARRQARLKKTEGLISLGGSDILAVRADGRVLLKTRSTHFQDTAKWRQIRAIYGGDGFYVGLRQDGTVCRTGIHSDGVAAVEQWQNIVDIRVHAGTFQCVYGLRADGTVVAAGDNTYNQCDVSQWLNIQAIYPGQGIVVGLRKDGTLEVAGRHYSDSYSRKKKPQWQNVADVVLLGETIVGIFRDGTIQRNDWHTFDLEWRNLLTVCSDELALRADGKVLSKAVIADKFWNWAEEVSKWKNIVDIAVGSKIIVGLRADGGVEISCAGLWNRGKDEIECARKTWHDVAAISVDYDMATFLFADGRVRAIAYDGEVQDVKGWKLFDNLDNLERERLIFARRSDGLCRHCGGSFKGLFAKKCTSCGKQKDY